MQARQDPRTWILAAGLALILTFAAYLPSLQNGFTNWDDDMYVTQNSLLTNPDSHALLTTPVSGNYHPLTMWSLVLNYRLSGLEPASYHGVNLILHLANTGLVFLFLRLLTGGKFWTTALGALLFGIHPMHVESVAWIAERKDVLFAFFYLAGLITYLKYLKGKHSPWLLATFVAFVLSMASKPAAIVFPFTLALLDWFRKRALTPTATLEKVPFLAVAVAGGLLTLHAQHVTGAMAVQWTPFEKALFASYGTVMYVVKLFLPVRLSAIYPYVKVPGHGLGAEYYVALAVIAVGVPALLYLARRHRPTLFGVAFFFVNIALVLQFATVGQAVMAERYTYLPYIGLFFTLAWWLDERQAPLAGRIPARPILVVLFALLVPFSLYQTWTRCGVWRDSGTLWNDTIAKYPRKNVDAYNYRGQYYQQVGRIDAALADFDQAIAMAPRAPRAWNYKGMLLAQENQFDSALACFNRAVVLRPDYAAAWNNRGGAKLRRGDAAGAIEDISRAVALDPLLWDAYTNRALAQIATRNDEAALADLRRALALQPGRPDNHIYLNAAGLALGHLGRFREAVGEFDRAIAQTTLGDARLGGYYLNRSGAWRALGDKARALEDAREAQRRGIPVDAAYLGELTNPDGR